MFFLVSVNFDLSSPVSLYLEGPSLCNKLCRVMKEGIPGFLTREEEGLLTVLDGNFVRTGPQDIVVFQDHGAEMMGIA